MTKRAIANREAIKSSTEFLAFVQEQMKEAERRREDRRQEISDKNLAIARSFSDHQAFELATKDEIAELDALIADDEHVITAATMALRRPMVQHAEVKTELEGQQ